jgi:hypothetical protein
MAQAQVISFKNNTNCTLYATMLADFNCTTPTGPGGNFYSTQLMAIPANSLTQFNLNTFAFWNGTGPTLTGEQWLAVKLSGNLACSTNAIVVGKSGCATLWPVNAAMVMNPACNSCTTVKANWVGTGPNYTVDINP